MLEQKETRPIAISCVLLANSDQPTDQWTGQPTNGQTNKAAYRVACMQLKISWLGHVSQGDSVLFSQGRKQNQCSVSFKTRPNCLKSKQSATDRPTNQWTNKVAYRVACTLLKMPTGFAIPNLSVKGNSQRRTLKQKNLKF